MSSQPLDWASADDLPLVLGEQARLDALARTGLGATPDPMFDRFAALVRDVLNVPVALVSLVDTSRQVFPGACGLAEPWLGQRQTPLSHSFCQHVVHTARPLVISDAREDQLVRDNLAVAELGVVGYAGMPLTDADGNVLGSLCAIDTKPRHWTPAELSLLADLAAACCDSLRLRIATGAARRDERVARSDRRRAGAAFDRSQMLLRASAALAATASVDDVIAAVRQLVIGNLDPAYVDVALLAGPETGLGSGVVPPVVADLRLRSRRGATTPSALATATGVPVLLPDPESIAREAPDALDAFVQMGWQSAASVPLPGPRGPVGALTFVWKQPNALSESEQAVLSALGGYVAQALQRAATLDDRRTAAATLQKALLTDLPRFGQVRMAARYLPAHRGDHVGGDWYDAVAVDEHRLALVIGDVTGHNVAAAAAMSQLRSILRALLVDRQESPAAMLRRLEHISRTLGSGTLASVVLAYLDTSASGGHVLTWANAGHPPPLLRTAGGVTGMLDGADPLLGAVRHASRRNHTTTLAPGSMLLLYTDGLVETRHSTIDAGIDAVRGVLADPSLDDPQQLADVLLALPHGSEDDVAVLAVSTDQADAQAP